MDAQNAINNGGATGLSYTNSGERTLPTRSGLAERTIDRGAIVTRQASDIREALSRPEQSRQFTTDRNLTDPRTPLVRDTAERGFYNEPIPRTVADLRDRLARTDNVRMLEYMTTGQNGAAGQIPASEQQQKTPLDFRIEDLFRGYFNEPVRGSSDKSGEFLFIPPAQSVGSNNGMILLLLVGVGVVGYYAYRKFKGGD